VPCFWRALFVVIENIFGRRVNHWQTLHSHFPARRMSCHITRALAGQPADGLLWSPLDVLGGGAPREGSTAAAAAVAWGGAAAGKGPLEEGETTDTGSAHSDAESVCSSGAVSKIASLDTVPAVPTGSFRMRSPAELHVSSVLKTFMDAVPTAQGPCAETKQSAPVLAAPAAAAAWGQLTTAFASAPALPVAPPPSHLEVRPHVAPAVPPPPTALFPQMGICAGGTVGDELAKTSAREAMLARARREGRPLQVRMPQEAAAALPSAMYLDPTLPAKKRVAFHELAHITAAVMQKLQPGEPVKKKPTKFLLANPKPVVLVQPPPGEDTALILR